MFSQHAGPTLAMCISIFLGIGFGIWYGHTVRHTARALFYFSFWTVGLMGFFVLSFTGKAPLPTWATLFYVGFLFSTFIAGAISMARNPYVPERVG